jgi:helicase MOV-10
VTTVVTAGRVFTAGCPLGHFSHVFIDEAGHAMEPEALIALAGELIAVVFIWPNLM